MNNKKKKTSDYKYSQSKTSSNRRQTGEYRKHHHMEHSESKILAFRKLQKLHACLE